MKFTHMFDIVRCCKREREKKTPNGKRNYTCTKWLVSMSRMEWPINGTPERWQPNDPFSRKWHIINRWSDGTSAHCCPSIVESVQQRASNLSGKYERAAMFCHSLMPIIPLNYQFYLIFHKHHYIFFFLLLAGSNTVKPYTHGHAQLHTGKWQTIQWHRREWKLLLVAIVGRMA